MKVINLFGGPGISKSTTATGIFHKLKLRGVNCEYVSEYAKSLVWRNRPEDLADQLYITAKQNRSLDCLRGKVDFAISDSPLLLGIHYAPSSYLRGYDEMVLDLFNSYKNTNFLLTRVKKYNPAGRVQTEEQAREIDGKIQELLDTRGIPYTIITGDEHASDTIIEEILAPDTTEVYRRLRSLFSSSKEMTEWLNYPNKGFQGRKPVDMINSGDGRLILNMVNHIEQGTYI